ncbi:ankyrin repeat-containing domain protein [Coprinopsis sp. MPI-PUGE-AT-0042]|nr:ankyrin repeat-containing domain protein [Coprinopsis sp. MPI-PUGE-AT-0042]
MQQDALAKSTEGTCLWLTTGEIFLVWIDKGRILWGIGIPGAGKTILSSIVIRYLERLADASEGRICVAYVYNRYSEPLDMRDILGSLVSQIAERHPDAGPLLASLYAKHKRERTKPSPQEIKGLLLQIIQLGKTLFFVVDALDELRDEDRSVLIGLLASLPDTRIFITSRPLEALQNRFSEARIFNIAAHPSDVDLLIRESLDRNPHLVALFEDSEFHGHLVRTIREKAGGMFLHARLQLEALRHCISIQDAEETLDQFPADIEAVYMNTWQRIVSQPPRHANVAKLALLWVLHVDGAMDIDVLRHALATSPDTYAFQPKRLVPASVVISVCCGLIEVDEKTRHVRLIHYTTKEAILPRILEIFTFPHAIPARICISHLTNCGMQKASFDTLESFEDALEQDRLLGYAYGSWAHHVCKSLHCEPVTKAVTGFVLGCSNYPLTDFSRTLDFLGPLHVAAYYGLDSLLLPATQLQSPNACTVVDGSSPLMLACEQGEVACVQGILLLTDVDVNLPGNRGMGLTALMVACMCGQANAVRLLLQAPGIDVNAVEVLKSTALIWACRNGYTQCLKLLLDVPGINVNAVSATGTALICACQYWHLETVKFLLGVPGIDVNAVDCYKGLTALTWATLDARIDIIELLLSFPGIMVRKDRFA